MTTHEGTQGAAITATDKLGAIYSRVHAVHSEAELMALTHELILQSDYLSASRLFQEYLNKYPISAQIANDYAICLQCCGEMDTAISYYQSAIKLDDANPDYYYNLGSAYLKCGEFDNGIAMLEFARQVNPEDAEILNTLGEGYLLINNLDKAYDLFHDALCLAPNQSEVLYNLAKLLELRGEAVACREILKIAMHFNPNNPLTEHAYHATQNSKLERASKLYVKRVFDRYASYFDQHILTSLKYCVPEQMASMLVQVAMDKLPFDSVLDLGCGTGLMAEAMQASCHSIIGVDISAGMLAQAQQKNIYDQVYEGDILDFFESIHDAYALIIAADVFIYLGDLNRYFHEITKHLTPDGIFAFSIEVTTEPDYYLQHSGRFAHNPIYINKLIDAYQLAIVYEHEMVIRQEFEQPVPGKLYFVKFCGHVSVNGV